MAEYVANEDVQTNLVTSVLETNDDNTNNNWRDRSRHDFTPPLNYPIYSNVYLILYIYL